METLNNEESYKQRGYELVKLRGVVAKLTHENYEISKEINRSKIQLKTRDNIIQKINKEKEDLLTRLSEFAGDKLCNNNGAIINLNDPNNSNALQETFENIYTNGTTDLYDIMESENKYENLDNTYEDNTPVFAMYCYNILMRIYKYCDMEIYTTNLNELAMITGDDNIKKGNLSKDSEKFLIQLKTLKNNYVDSLLDIKYSKLLKYFNEHRGTSSTISMIINPKYKVYTRQCFDLCYRMLSKTPPLKFSNKIPEKGSIPDSECWKVTYDNGNGEKRFSTIIWPLLEITNGDKNETVTLIQGKYVAF